MTSIPGASSKSRRLLGRLSAICPPLGIPARLQRQQFRAHIRNFINLERLRPACSLSLDDPSVLRWLCCSSSWSSSWRRRKTHKVVVQATNCLDLSRSCKLNDGNVTQKKNYESDSAMIGSTRNTLARPVRESEESGVPHCHVANSM